MSGKNRTQLGGRLVFQEGCCKLLAFVFGHSCFFLGESARFAMWASTSVPMNMLPFGLSDAKRPRMDFTPTVHNVFSPIWVSQNQALKQGCFSKSVPQANQPSRNRLSSHNRPLRTGYPTVWCSSVFIAPSPPRKDPRKKKKREITTFRCFFVARSALKGLQVLAAAQAKTGFRVGLSSFWGANFLKQAQAPKQGFGNRFVSKYRGFGFLLASL